MSDTTWMTFCFIICLLYFAKVHGDSKPALDKKGYILYCPCMGRFGNQADHFLGALAFAHDLDRTLVLPPWVEYEYSQPRSVQVPFDRYFKVEPLTHYHRVMTMEQFMTTLAPVIWPAGNRTVFCYGPRAGSVENTCNAKDGNPFGPFWDTFNVDFDHSEFYSGLGFDTSEQWTVNQWNNRYPPSSHPVIAFTGAPASFPVDERNVKLHQFMEWSDHINSLAETFIQDNIPKRPFLGIHLRNGADWVNVCKHVADSKDRHLFASPQCLGYNHEYGKLTDDLCFPSEQIVIRHVKQSVKRISAVAVFVATDNQSFKQEIEKAFRGKVKVVQRLPSNPHVDLAILGKADHFVGNCVSSFSAFAARERKARGKTSEFWGFPPARPAQPHSDL